MTAIDDDPVFETAGEHEVVALLRTVIDIIANAKPLPLSSSVRIESAEVLDLLDEAVERLPEELRQARWLLKEREEFLAKVEREGDEILEEARNRAEKLVARQEIVRNAKLQAQRTIEAAEAEARKQKHAAEDWCDQHLARFEIMLDRVAKTTAAGREKLRTIPRTETPGEPIDQEAEDAASAFFDQDF